MATDLREGRRAHMRTKHLFSFLVLASLSCGTFGGSSDETTSPAPPPEDPSKPPVIIEGERLTGAFVSSSRGGEGADGSESRPFKTIKEAMVLAQQRGERVIVCAEQFDENVELLEGVSLYGYFDCTTSPWSKTTKHAVVISPNADPSLAVTKLEKPVRVEGFDFIGPDQTQRIAGVTAASTAVLVRDSKDVAFVEVTIRGGKGTNGANGAPPTKANTFSGNPNGTASVKQKVCPQFANCNTNVFIGGAGGIATCAVGQSRPGGRGGEGATMTPTNQEVLPPPPFGPADARGHGFAATLELAKGGVYSGTEGAAGANGVPGQSGTNGVWSFSRDGFLPGDGSPGQPGVPGQGGGGGGGAGACWRSTAGQCAAPGGTSVVWTSTGAGGGAGGCGGLPGTPGRGGGASIGLFVVDSMVKIERSKIEGGDGGAAGAGSLGGAGLPGGAGGEGGPYPNVVAEWYAWAGRGGAGGAGGPGGVSGHGAPGPSIGLVWTGTRPEIAADVVLAGGKAGAGHPALAHPNAQGIPAVVGDVKSEHSF